MELEMLVEASAMLHAMMFKNEAVQLSVESDMNGQDGATSRKRLQILFDDVDRLMAKAFQADTYHSSVSNPNESNDVIEPSQVWRCVVKKRKFSQAFGFRPY